MKSEKKTLKMKLDVLKMSPEERHRYDLYLMAMVNEQDAIETALNKGKLNGKLEVAKEMQKSGMDMETIVALTGLSPSEITAHFEQDEG